MFARARVLGGIVEICAAFVQQPCRDDFAKLAKWAQKKGPLRDAEELERYLADLV